MENPIGMDDLGVPLFLETPIWWSLKGPKLLMTFFCFESHPFLGDSCEFSWCLKPQGVSWHVVFVFFSRWWQLSSMFFIFTPKPWENDPIWLYHIFSNGVKPCWNHQLKLVTPPKFNIEPENDGLEDDFPFPGVKTLRFQPLIFWGVIENPMPPTISSLPVIPFEDRFLDPLSHHTSWGEKTLGVPAQTHRSSQGIWI